MSVRPAALVSLLLLAPIASAQDDPGAGPLSREEIEQGWIRLFDGETAFGWTVRAEDPANAVRVADGAMTIAGPATVRTTTEFGAFDLRVDAQAEGNATLAMIPSEEGSPAMETGLGGGDGPTSVQVGPGELPDRVAIAFRVPPGATLTVREAVLRPMGTEPIFNGKDLTGWNVLEGGESVYSVTEEGNLNVKNGRGDIQTEGLYDDFVLQLDVFSNGEHLNSGIFFRALPGQFWSGYESQIRNEYEGDDRTKPVDFGTGAIYRRQAARKVVADDFEWFTKTIVAHDNHFAVWVDGYQVTDWTDDRPPADNGRNGYKAEAGVISIQGHDPTTDLSFRNLRIAELPGE